jgi:hypothetical protein
MKTPSVIAWAAAAAVGATASGQTARVTYQLSRAYLPSGSTWPMLFGDHAQIVAGVTFSPPVGTPVTYTPPPGNGTGTVAGLEHVSFDVIACDTIHGTWTLSGTGFPGTTGTTWGLRQEWGAGSAGTPQSGSDVLGVTAGAFTLPGVPVQATNPIVEIWRGRFDPHTWYAGDQMRLTLRPRDAALFVQYGTNSSGQPLYTTIPAVADPVWVNIFQDTGAPPPCYPIVVADPHSTSAFAGQPAQFHVVASWLNPVGCTTHTYRWRHDCQMLSDGPRISGVLTDTLRIDPVMPGDEGQYDVRADTWADSNAAWLTVVCYANCDQSTQPPTLNVNDFVCFMSAFASGQSYANCDGSTQAPVLTINDFVCFQQSFAAGCP